jgi:hypothetical protein
VQLEWTSTSAWVVLRDVRVTRGVGLVGENAGQRWLVQPFLVNGVRSQATKHNTRADPPAAEDPTAKQRSDTANPKAHDGGKYAARHIVFPTAENYVARTRDCDTGADFVFSVHAHQ